MDVGGCSCVSGWLLQERRDNEWRKRGYEEIKETDLLDTDNRPAKVCVAERKERKFLFLSLTIII